MISFNNLCGIRFDKSPIELFVGLACISYSIKALPPAACWNLGGRFQLQPLCTEYCLHAEGAAYRETIILPNIGGIQLLRMYGHV